MAQRALVENLQLQITDKARQLRAQYSVQAEGIKTRIQLRVYRIPSSLRNTTLGALLENQDQNGRPGASTTAGRPVKTVATSRNAAQESQNRLQTRPSPTKALKRVSDTISDKENDDLSNPKKRARGIPQPTQQQQPQPQKPSTVLSPRSANSTPRSPHQALPTKASQPSRPSVSPHKSLLARPTSPLKPQAQASRTITTSSTAVKPSPAAARASRKATSKPAPPPKSTSTSAAAAILPPPRTTRGAARASITSQGTDTSSTSSGTSATTIVRKMGAAAAAVGAMGSPRKVAAGVRGAVRKAAAGGRVRGEVEKVEKGTAVPAAPAAGRSLRKRN